MQKEDPTKREVFLAEPYRPGAMGSLGNAAYMLVRQYRFPQFYDPAVDEITHTDHDRIFQQSHAHASRCFKEHTGTGELAFPNWVQGASAKKVFAFLRDLLKTHETHKDRPEPKWTGFRIMGTVHRGNGYPVWSLQLFANKSKAKVYTGPWAPNVKGYGEQRVIFGPMGGFAEIRRLED